MLYIWPFVVVVVAYHSEETRVFPERADEAAESDDEDANADGHQDDGEIKHEVVNIFNWLVVVFVALRVCPGAPCQHR